MKKKRQIKIKRGDFFATRNPMLLGRIINAVQVFWSKDNRSIYSHNGIICKTQPKILSYEAYWTVCLRDFCKVYKNENICIARYLPPEQEKNLKSKIDNALCKLSTYQGDWYPFYRLFFFLIPPLAKYIHFNRLVCSELVAKFLKLIGARLLPYYGVTPDMLVDEWHKWKNFEIIFEGKFDDTIELVSGDDEQC